MTTKELKPFQTFVFRAHPSPIPEVGEYVTTTPKGYVVVNMGAGTKAFRGDDIHVLDTFEYPKLDLEPLLPKEDPKQLVANFAQDLDPQLAAQQHRPTGEIVE